MLSFFPLLSFPQWRIYLSIHVSHRHRWQGKNRGRWDKKGNKEAKNHLRVCQESERKRKEKQLSKEQKKKKGGLPRWRFAAELGDSLLADTFFSFNSSPRMQGSLVMPIPTSFERRITKKGHILLMLLLAPNKIECSSRSVLLCAITPFLNLITI